MVKLPPPSPENAAWDSDEEEDGLADQRPLELKWISVGEYEVAVCSLPGDRLGGARRSLVADLETLKNGKITDVYVTCTEGEMQRAKVGSLLVDYLVRGFTVHHYPLDNEATPTMQLCMELLDGLLTSLCQGHKVIIHCTDGLGRSCLVLVLLSMMLDSNLPGMLAIECVRQSQGPGAIQTVKQYNFIMDFHKNLAEFRQQQKQPYTPPPPHIQ